MDKSTNSTLTTKLTKELPESSNTISKKDMEKSPFKNILTVIVLSFGCFSYGYTVGVFNSFLDDLLKDGFQKSEEERKYISGNIMSAATIGYVLAALSSGVVTTSLGTLMVIRVESLFTIIGSCLFFIPNLKTIFVAQLLIGLSGGLNFSSVVVHLNETMIKKRSALGGAMVMVVYNLAALISYLIAPIVG